MPAEHVDVLIVGAGISGVGAAYHLKKHCPKLTFTVLEGRERIGGTWDLFRYPGVRSDSDMATLGYSFRPWDKAKSIADGGSIREYVRETAEGHGLDREIRFGHKVLGAQWSSSDAQWTVQAQSGGEAVELTCSFLFACSGYYNYEKGYKPDFPGEERFTGQVIHPQHWPDDLDYTGKRVVVIGSGATAVTIVPAMAETAGHVTMLQRSPSYMATRPAIDPFGVKVRDRLPKALADPIIRWKSVAMGLYTYRLCRKSPDKMKGLLRHGVRAQLPDGYDIDTHFKPAYEPWDQRLCLVPDGDMFKAISAGKASVVTDHIETFTETGIKLKSGETLDANIIITATGLNMQAVGGIKLTVDAVDVDLPETVAYKGIMLSGVPNLAFTLGYVNASWTLRADLVARYVCRVLNHMKRRGLDICVPTYDGTKATSPLLDLSSGYVKRGQASMPKQGDSAPWRMYHDYGREMVTLRSPRVEGEGLTFKKKSPAPQRSESVSV